MLVSISLPLFSLAASNYHIKKGVVTPSLALRFVFSNSCSPPVSLPTHALGEEKKSDGVSLLCESRELKDTSQLGS